MSATGLGKHELKSIPRKWTWEDEEVMYWMLSGAGAGAGMETLCDALGTLTITW